jgi:hypothetical protein
MTDAVRDAHPPRALVRVLNPIVRTMLLTPLGHVATQLALLEFAGRRTGRRYRVVVGWYDVDGVGVVFTPASWRTNFVGGATAVVRHRGHAQHMTGTLVTDTSDVADALIAVLASGTSARALGLRIPPEHKLTATDVAAVRRAMVRLQPDASRAPASHGSAETVRPSPRSHRTTHPPRRDPTRTATVDSSAAVRVKVGTPATRRTPRDGRHGPRWQRSRCGLEPLLPPDWLEPPTWP